MNHIDTMKLALNYLDGLTRALKMDDTAHAYQVIAALREALAEQPAQQEPYGWHTEDHLTDRSATTYSKDVADRWKSKGWPVTPLYTSPQEQPSKPWVGLTPEQRATVAEANNMLVDDDLFDAIEAKLKEKNT